MTDISVKNIEEMSNKLIEYIHAVSGDDKDYELNCMAIASKMIIASFSFDTNNGDGVMLSMDEITDKCMALSGMIFSIAIH